jgi:hypothetical protein
MTNDDIIIRVTHAFLRPYPILAGEAVLLSGPARIGRQVRLYLTPTTYKTLTLESEMTASRWDPKQTLRSFTYSGAIIDPSEIQGEAWLTTMSYEEARRYSEKHPMSEPETAATAGSIPPLTQQGS